MRGSLVRVTGLTAISRHKPTRWAHLVGGEQSVTLLIERLA